MSQEHELPMLAGIAAALAWLESLAVIVSGPLLTVGLAVALVDLLTDGALLASTPALLYVWAVSQAVGVDAQLVGSAYRVRQSLRSGHRWAAAGYVVLVLALGYVAIVAAQVFATQASQGITTAQALAQWGMDPVTWIWQRAVLAVVLVVLSGFLRYTPPVKAKQSAQDERATLERELELEPLRQQLRKTKAGGIASLARQTFAAAVGKEDAPDKPPTGPGSPVAAPAASVAEEALAGRVVALPRPNTSRSRRPAAARRARAGMGVRSGGVRTPAASASYEGQARTAWADGAQSIERMKTATGMSHSVAQSWVRTLKAEESARAEGQAAQ